MKELKIIMINKNKKITCVYYIIILGSINLSPFSVMSKLPIIIDVLSFFNFVQTVLFFLILIIIFIFFHFHFKNTRQTIVLNALRGIYNFFSSVFFNFQGVKNNNERRTTTTSGRLSMSKRCLDNVSRQRN